MVVKGSPRVVLVAIGSRGDVQPHVALARALRAVGVDAVVLGPPEYASLAADAGVPLESLGTGFADFVAAHPADARRLGRAGAAGAHRVLLRWHTGAAESFAAAADRVVGPGDVVIAGLAGTALALALADDRGCRPVHASFFPVLPTSDAASAIMPLARGRTSALNRWWAQTVLWPGMLELAWPHADALRRLRGLPSVDRAETTRRVAALPTLMATSPTLVPPAPDWPDTVEYTGPWVLEPDQHWQPPAELAEFLAAGELPVYVGFGSFAALDPERDLRLVTRAAARAGVRVIVPEGSSGVGVVSTGSTGVELLAIPDVPFEWLFPRVAAVVHHGGAGTTVAGLRAGVPGLVVAHGLDQPYFGERLAALGVGPRPLSRGRLTVGALADALRALATGPDAEGYRRAASAAARIRREDGTGTAIAVLRRLGYLPGSQASGGT